MYWDAIYKALDLCPLDEFIRKSVRQNVKAGLDDAILRTDSPAYRNIGASTWMCACAAYLAAKGVDTMILAGELSKCERLRKSAVAMALLLDEGLKVAATMKEATRFDNGARVYISSFQRNNTRIIQARSSRHRVRSFVDDLWKERAIRRHSGPFAMAQEIQFKKGRYLVYAEDDEFLMEVTAEGAQGLVDAVPTVSCRGFTLIPRTPSR